MKILESPSVDAAIQRLMQRNYNALHSWVWANPTRAIVVDWDGDNEIEIAERALLLGASAASAGNSEIIRANTDSSTFFFIEDSNYTSFAALESKVVSLINSL